MTLRLYGVVRAGTALPTSTPDGKPAPAGLDLVTSADLAAVTSPQPDEPLTEQDATSHLDVLCALATAGPVLPLRFGTTAPDADAVRTEVLDTAHDDLAARLTAVDGLAELRVEVSFAEQDILRDALAADPDLRSLADQRVTDLAGRVQLGEAVARAAANQCRARGERLVAPVIEHAELARRLDVRTDLATDDVAGAPFTDRWALLTRIESVPELDQLVARVQRDNPDASVTYLGPLPLFTFLDDLPVHTGEPASRWGW